MLSKSLSKKTTTKIERVVADLLIKNHIPFKMKTIIKGRECDFIIDGRIILEVDGIIHKQPSKQIRDISKVLMLCKEGYRIFLRFSAKEIRQDKERLIKLIKNL